MRGQGRKNSIPTLSLYIIDTAFIFLLRLLTHCLHAPISFAVVSWFLHRRTGLVGTWAFCGTGWEEQLVLPCAATRTHALCEPLHFHVCLHLNSSTYTPACHLLPCSPPPLWAFVPCAFFYFPTPHPTPPLPCSSFMQNRQPGHVHGMAWTVDFLTARMLYPPPCPVPPTPFLPPSPPALPPRTHCLSAATPPTALVPCAAPLPSRAHATYSPTFPTPTLPMPTHGSAAQTRNGMGDGPCLYISQHASRALQFPTLHSLLRRVCCFPLCDQCPVSVYLHLYSPAYVSSLHTHHHLLPLCLSPLSLFVLLLRGMHFSSPHACLPFSLSALLPIPLLSLSTTLPPAFPVSPPYHHSPTYFFFWSTFILPTSGDWFGWMGRMMTILLYCGCW